MNQLNRTLVIIIQYGTYTNLEQCIHYLQDTSTPLVDVCVVDNNQNPALNHEFYNEFSTVNVIFPDRNLGFSGGCNTGIRFALEQKYDFCFIINNDAYIAGDDIVTLEKVLDAHEDIGLIGPIVHSNITDEDYIGMYIDWNRGKSCYNKLTDNMKTESIIDVGFVEGCGMMLPRRSLEAIQGFDERYFLYWEDADINIQVQNAGFRTAVSCEVTMNHSCSQSTGFDSPIKEYYMNRNSLLFFSLHTQGFFNRRKLITRMVSRQIRRGFRCVLRHEPLFGKIRLLAVWEFLLSRFGYSSKLTDLI
jgi:GT2 family glycosyltransferase